MQETTSEADRLCRYLSGRQASEVLARRYGDALVAMGLDPGLRQSRLSRIRREGTSHDDDSRKLRLMAALLETDPDYKRLFRNSPSRLIAHLEASVALLGGVLKRLI